MKIRITDIIIGERQRSPVDLENLDDLETMSDPDIGQLQPIGVKTNNDNKPELVWGRRRLAKATKLGWEYINAVDVGKISDSLHQEMELVEDIGRKDRSWQDKCRAMFKLFKLKQREKKAIGQNWTVRMMSALTGDSKSSVAYMVQLGEELTSNPEGESAKAGSYLDGLKAIFKRNEKLLTAELEKRRQATLAQVNATIAEEEPSAEFVQSLDTTPDAVEVTIHAINKSFADAVRFKDYQPESFHRVVGYDFDMLDQVFDVLKKDGIAVLWYTSFEAFLDNYSEIVENYVMMRWPLVWNKIKPVPSEWPWSPNPSWGIVIRKSKVAYDKSPVSSTCSVIETEPGKLHYHVVDLSLAGAPENMPVLVLGESANPLAVVESGRIPVLFEPDPVKYEKAVADLREHYTNTIPGVIFK